MTPLLVVKDRKDSSTDNYVKRITNISSARINFHVPTSKLSNYLNMGRVVPMHLICLIHRCPTGQRDIGGLKQV